MGYMTPTRRSNISRGVSIALRSNWKQAKPCPKCGHRFYGNYSGNLCKKCRTPGELAY